MSRNRRVTVDVGNAISIEDALAIMVVIFVLFFLFIVPLVNIDRAKLEQAQQDDYWVRLSSWLENQQTDSAKARPFLQAFGLKGQKVVVTDAGDKTYIEALDENGDITVIAKKGTDYISLIVQGHSSVVTYRYGNIYWSEAEKEWFTLNNLIDYGNNDSNVAMQKEYRAWTNENSGF